MECPQKQLWGFRSLTEPACGTLVIRLLGLGRHLALQSFPLSSSDWGEDCGLGVSTKNEPFSVTDCGETRTAESTTQGKAFGWASRTSRCFSLSKIIKNLYSEYPGWRSWDNWEKEPNSKGPKCESTGCESVMGLHLWRHGADPSHAKCFTRELLPCNSIPLFILFLCCIRLYLLKSSMDRNSHHFLSCWSTTRSSRTRNYFCTQAAVHVWGCVHTHTRTRYGHARSLVYEHTETDRNSLGLAQIPDVFNVSRKDLHGNEKLHLNWTLDTPSEFAGAIGQLDIHVPLPYMFPCSFKVLSIWDETNHMNIIPLWLIGSNGSEPMMFYKAEPI